MQKRIDFPAIVAGLVAAAALVAGLFFQFDYALNADNATMLSFAQRIFDGGVPVRDYYDTNPPLNVVIYIPALILAHLSSLPIWHALTVYILLLCALSATLCYTILCRLSFIDRSDVLAFTALYALANIYISHIFFGERDQIILLGLVPLVLAQLALNENIKLPVLGLYASLVFGAISVFIKPHYGLMPALMILWRLGRERSLRTLLRPDLMVLSSVTGLYIAAALTIWRPYFDVIAPDVFLFYAGSKAGAIVGVRVMICLFAAAGVTIAALKQNSQKRKFLLVLAALELCFLAAYVAQFKGFYYHLVPAQIMAFCAAGMAGVFAVRMPAVRAVIMIAAVMLLAIVFPVRSVFPTHEEFADLPVGKILDDCPQPCRFFMFNDYNYMIHETALYKNAFHASRFPVFWFEPSISCGPYEQMRGKYETMVTEDFARWQPSLVLLYKGEDVCPDGSTPPFDFVDFFSHDPAFVQEWQNYALDKTVTFNRRDYFHGTSADHDHMMTFDIYRRKTP